jgi:tetratricopeptide (TPR) repeat protein
MYPSPSDILRSAVVLVSVLLAPVAVDAQMVGFGDPLSEADMLYLAGEPRLSLERLEPTLAADSTDFGALWRAARAAVVIAIDQEEADAQEAWLEPALAWAERAVAVRPDDIDGLYWRGVAAGRLAMNAGPGRAVELAEVVYDDAHAILARDSLHGGAHNMLGKLSYEVMSLSRVKRLIARTFMSSPALDDTSWEKAEEHLIRAAELWPDFVLFHFDLAQLYRKRDRREEAIVEYRRALGLPTVHPTDLGLKRQATVQLEAWGVPVDAPEVEGR